MRTTVSFDAEMDFQQADTSPPRSFEIKVRSLEVTPQDMAAVQIADGISDDREYIQAMFDAMEAESRAGRMPPVAEDYLCFTPVTLPENGLLRVPNRIIGLGTTGWMNMSSGQLISEAGGSFRNFQLVLTGGSPKVSGFRYTGYNFDSAIWMTTADATYEDVEIDGVFVKDANYLFARNGQDSTARGVTLTRLNAYNLAGDVVLFNICPNDSGIVVDGIRADLIGDPALNSNYPDNWGMIASFAGLAYDATFADENTITDVTVRNIYARRFCRGVHFEAASRFKIENIHATEVSDIYSPGSLLECATVGIYGSTDFMIDGVRTDGAVEKGGVHLQYGGTPAELAAETGVPCRNFTVRNLDLRQGALIVNQSFDDARNEISDAKVRNGSALLVGRAGELVLDNVRAQRPAATGVAMNLDMNGSQPHNAETSKLIANSVDARNATDGISRTLSISSVTTVDANNFLGNLAVASLPAAAMKGETAFATDGRNSGEGAAAGTGSLVAYSGTAWRVPGLAGAVAA